MPAALFEHDGQVLMEFFGVLGQERVGLAGKYGDRDAPRAPQALRPNPLLRLPGRALSHSWAFPMSPSTRRRSDATLTARQLFLQALLANISYDTS
jgi:hypothetical protein